MTTTLPVFEGISGSSKTVSTSFVIRAHTIALYGQRAYVCALNITKGNELSRVRG
jgi:hypothetical protein